MRDQLGVVLQDNYLFQGSIADNIRFGKLDATDEEVIAKAAISANAHQFIVEELAQGYQTEVGERGGDLSGGQRQRISIARQYLETRVLILDEATSALDSDSESKIQQALSRLMEGRTSFVIAHRLSTILDATSIVALKDGRIAEMGTHEELLALDGLYADMYHKQFKKKEPILVDIDYNTNVKIPCD